MSKKLRLEVVIFGDSFSGKKTLIGHLIFKSGGLDRRTIERYEKQARESNDPNFLVKYRWVIELLSKLQSESYIDLSSFLYMFETVKYRFNSNISFPSQPEYFIKQIISQKIPSDICLFVVSAATGEFEAGISSIGKIYEQLLLILTAEMRNIIICINKMDEPSVLYSETRFQQIKNQLSEFIQKIGYNYENIPLIPISCWRGDNITHKSPNMTWYKGPILIEALNQSTPPPDLSLKPLRVPIRDIYKVPGVGIVCGANVDSGILKRMKVFFAPSEIYAEVRSIEYYYELVDHAIPGDNIGFSLRQTPLGNIHRGDVLGDPDHDPPRATESFVAQVLILNSTGKISCGFTPTIHCNSTCTPCKVEQLVKKINFYSGKTFEENPTFIQRDDFALVKFVPCKPVVIEKFSDFPTLGCFSIYDKGETIGIGVVKYVTKKQKI